MKRRLDMHRGMGNVPLAYFVSIRTYGTWLHGDARGSVDAWQNGYGMPWVEENALKEESERGRMRGSAYLLNAESAEVMEKTVAEVCAHRKWKLWIVRARTNHVHVVVSAPVSPERVMNDLKAWGTRRLREAGYAGRGQEVWADHGSTPYLWREEDLEGAIAYVERGQGGPLKR